MSLKLLKFILSALLSLLLAWIVESSSSINFTEAFLFFFIGLPIAALANKVKNGAAHLAAYFILKRRLINNYKTELQKLPISSADEWTDFEAFYDTDEAIYKFRSTKPKAFASIVRYELETLKRVGCFIDAIINTLLFRKAMNELWSDSVEKEHLEFAKSKGYESYAEYLAENALGDDLRESWKKKAEIEINKRKKKN